jgi:hypothetical protein
VEVYANNLASVQKALKDMVVCKEKDIFGVSFEHAKQHVASEEALTDFNKLPATKR